MIKTILIAAISVNGIIAEHVDQVSTDWTSKEDKKFFSQKTKELGIMIVGRKTFETFGQALPGRTMVVMSRSPLHIGGVPTPRLGGRVESGGGEGAGRVVWTDLSPRDLLANLESKGYSSVALCGGSQIYSVFLREGCIDELFLTVEPVIFGKGVPLIEGAPRVNLQLIEMKPLNEQTILLHYRIKK
ncbi:dihydrofolate reductase [Candidatus Uhrbacteria bacterium]|nr:dihydrofolate reductase [Candidatus Uhrbacteria bacterium]